MAGRLKSIRLLLYPFLFFSLAIYLCVYLISPLKLAYQVSLVSGFLFTVLVFLWEKPRWRDLFSSFFSWRSFLLLVPILFILFIFGFVLSPMVKTILVDGKPLLGLTALGDYYKHLYVLTSIKTGGLPPHHPFFPSANLSYYYGYYLLPAAVSSVFSLDLAKVFFFYLLFTTFIVLFVVVQLSLIFFQTWYQRLLSITLFIFGTGLDIIPTLIQAKTGILTANHIEFWSQILNLNNFLVNNLYTALLWVPQHSLTGLIVFITGVILIKETKVPIFWLTPAIWFSVVSSTFVSVSLFLWLGLFFFLVPRVRLRLLGAGFLAVCLLLPYLSGLIGRGSILSFGFYMTPFKYLSFLPFWLNCLLTFFTEYGLILIALPAFFVLHRRKNQVEALLITLAVSLPIVIGLFVRSSGFNDFSMRSVLPSQMALSFLMVYSLEKVEASLWKKTVFLLLILSFIPSMTGFFYEIHFRLIDRSIIEAPTSALLLSLRKNPIPNLAVLDNEDWVFLIPSYGYQTVYSPRLFDSGGYLSDAGLQLQLPYGNSVGSLFIDQAVGSSPLELASTRLKRWQDLPQFFRDHQSLNFVLPKYHGHQSVLNPWPKLLDSAGVSHIGITDNYYLFKGADIQKALSTQKISLDLSSLKQLFVDHDHRLYLRQGLWFIIGCRQETSSDIRLEFTDYGRVLDQKSSANAKNCAGNLYYQPQNEQLKLSSASLFDSLYLVPVTLVTEQVRTLKAVN